MSSGVEFEEDKFAEATRMSARMNASGASATGFSGWLVRKGLAKSEATAKWIQVAIIAFNMVVTILIVRMFL